ncbi:MAG: hypothetical protein ACM3JI_03060 [Anaerolineae bacterium]
MRFALASEHQDFFSKHHYIEFEDLISLNDVENLKQSIETTLAKRLHCKVQDLDNRSEQDLYKAGRDLWREDLNIKKTLFRPEICEIASSLFSKNPLRLGFDQAFRSSSFKREDLFKPPLSLQEISCLKDLCGAFIVRLSEDAPSLDRFNHDVPKKASFGRDFFFPHPQKRENLLFLSPQLLLTFQPLFNKSAQHFLLVSFCKDKTTYVLEKKDPNTHALKNQGYAFGDLLKNNTHPIVFR